VRRAEEIGSHEVVVVTDDVCGLGAATARPIMGHDVRVLRPSELASFIATLEPSDALMFIDARFIPEVPLDWKRFAREVAGYPGASFVVALGHNADRTVEQLRHDGDGKVHAIRRYYDRITWLEHKGHVVPYAHMSASACSNDQIESLWDLRKGMIANGVLTRDLPHELAVFDLRHESDAMALKERIIHQAVRQPTPAGYSRLSPDVLVGRGTLIHDSVRISGPVIIQHGVMIEEDVSIVGPTCIGAGSTIGRGSLIAQSSISLNSVVPPGSVIRHYVRPRRRPSNGDPSSAGIRTPAPYAHQFDAESARISQPSLTDRVARRRLFLCVKRVGDIAASLVGIVLLAPVYAIVSAIIKLDSSGPVLFTHPRERRGGGEFPCYKFRTMHSRAHQEQRRLYARNEVDGPQFKLERDPRITRVGHLLRTTNIDELPQLFNVLLGHMSLIGPRPSPFRENQICVPWRRARLSVRPGITGLWQLCRRQDRAQGDFQEWIHYDMMYVRHMSVWLDIKILVLTVATLGGRWSVPVEWLVQSRPEEFAAPAEFEAELPGLLLGESGDPADLLTTS